MATFEVVHEARDKPYDSTWTLCLQKGRLRHDDGTYDKGFRLIWRDTFDNLQAHRGQALIPDMGAVLRLLAIAINEGWADSIRELDSLDRVA